MERRSRSASFELTFSGPTISARRVMGLRQPIQSLAELSAAVARGLEYLELGPDGPQLCTLTSEALAAGEALRE